MALPVVRVGSDVKIEVEGVMNPYQNPNPVPDYMHIHGLITEAYRDDGILDRFESEDLESQGLSHLQARLVQETIFNPQETPGYLTSDEGDRYEKYRLGELKRMLNWQRPEPPLEVTYMGVGITQSFPLFINDPTKFDGPYPNDMASFRGIGIALGIGEEGIGEESQRDRSLFSIPSTLEGEFHLTLMQGESNDRIDPNDFAIDTAVDQAEETVNEEIDQGEMQVEGQVNGQVQGQTGIDPNLDLDVKDVDVSPEDLGFNELKQRRHARHTLGMLSFRFSIFSGISFAEDRVKLLRGYFNFGVGYMNTQTNVTRGSKNKKEKVSDNVVLGRITAEIDAVRWTTENWIFSLRAGGGILGGGSIDDSGEGAIGGTDLFYGAFLMRRF